jgi:hypothetical protein
VVGDERVVESRGLTAQVAGRRFEYDEAREPSQR